MAVDIHRKIDLKQTIKQWQKFTVKDWRDNLNKMRIGKTGQLYNSFLTSLAISSQGSPERIQFSFKYYGRFVDMGVGRGAKVGSGVRRPKKWYSKALAYSAGKLGDILAKRYGQKFAQEMVKSIETGKS